MRYEEMTDEQLDNRRFEVENELEYLNDELGHIGNEQYYRKFPECRPKTEFLKDHD